MLALYCSRREGVTSFRRARFSFKGGGNVFASWGQSSNFFKRPKKRRKKKEFKIKYLRDRVKIYIYIYCCCPSVGWDFPTIKVTCYVPGTTSSMFIWYSVRGTCIRGVQPYTQYFRFFFLSEVVGNWKWHRTARSSRQQADSSEKRTTDLLLCFRACTWQPLQLLLIINWFKRPTGCQKSKQIRFE